MKLCNTVDRISAYDSQTSHMNLSVIDHCHLADFFLITRVLLSYLDQEAAVDLFYDLIDTRKKSGEQVNRPFSSASAIIVWLVYAQVFVVISHASSHPRPSTSIRIRISSGTATVGWVSFSWKVTFSYSFVISSCCFYILQLLSVHLQK